MELAHNFERCGIDAEGLQALQLLSMLNVTVTLWAVGVSHTFPYFQVLCPTKGESPKLPTLCRPPQV